MPNEYEALAKMLLSTAQGAKVSKNFDKIAQAFNTPEGKQMLVSLAGNGGDVIKQAAAAAAEQDSNRAQALIANLLSTKEGAVMATQLMGILGG